MGAVLLTNEFPAAGISVFAELWYREPMAGAIYEHDPDLIFPGSDAERAPITVTYYILYVMMSGSKAPDFDAYELFRAAHSHNSTLYSHIVGLLFLHYNHGYRSVVKSYRRIEKPQAVIPGAFRFLMRGEIVSLSTI